MANTQVIRLTDAERFALGGVTVTPAARTLAIGAHESVIEPRVMQVLVTLDRRRGEVVGREALIDACWDGRTVGEDAINRAILKLRRALHEIGGDVTIETVAKVGYRLCVGELGSPADRAPLQDIEPASRPEKPSQPGQPTFRVPAATVAAVVAFMSLLGTGIWLWRGGGPWSGCAFH